MFGMSFVYVDLRGGHRHLLGAQPRARIHERPARRACPRASTPTLGPDATGIGWVFQYALVDKTGQARPRRAAHVPGLHAALRAGQRARASPRWRASAATRSSTRSPSIPNRLRAYGVTLDEVIDAIRAVEQRRGRPHPRDVRARVLRARARLHHRTSARSRRSRCAPAGRAARPLLVKDVGDGALRPRHPARAARVERRRRGGRRHRGHALRRERPRRHRAREEEARRAQAELPGGRRDDDRLRPLGAHRALDRHAAARAHRGGDRRQPRDHAVPAALPQLAAADPVAADQRGARRSSRWCCSTSRRRS